MSLKTAPFFTKRLGINITLAASLLTGLASANALESAPPAAVGLSATKVQDFKTELQRRIDAGEMPGAVLMVVRNGKIAVKEALGFRDRPNAAPLTTDAIFLVASMTKPIVSVAVMQLLEQGKLSLSDPLSKFIPEFKDMKVGVEKTNAEGKAELVLVNSVREITIQDLLRHTSGLTYGYFDDMLVDKLYLSNNLYDPDLNLEQQVAKLAKLPLKYQPGTTWNYGLSTDVLGRVIEVITGKSLDLALQQMVTGPLGMQDTNFWVEESKFSRVAFSNTNPATGNYLTKPPLKSKPTRLSGGGGLYTTAPDYARFCQMLLNKGQLDGVRILSRKSVELMTSNHLPAGVRAVKTSDVSPTPENGLGFGLGFAVRMEAGLATYLGSKGEFFWLGASGTNFVIDPSEKMITILLVLQPDKMYPNLRLMRNMGNSIIAD